MTFHKFLAILYVVLQGKIVKIQATTQNFIVALFYKINPVQIPQLLQKIPKIC